MGPAVGTPGRASESSLAVLVIGRDVGTLAWMTDQLGASTSEKELRGSFPRPLGFGPRRRWRVPVLVMRLAVACRILLHHLLCSGHE